jgi:3D (Asp-Asp-Asp) domain-containing protein
LGNQATTRLATKLGRVGCLFLVAAVGLAVAARAPVKADETFNLLAPAKLSGLQKRAVRLSEYSIVLATPGSAVPLLDPGDRTLGIALSHDDFCAASLQGTVQVMGVRYMVAGKGGTSLADCSDDCPSCDAFALGESRFLRMDHPGALSARTYGLVAYRTVAVRDGALPAGTVLYIPAARGLRLPNGRRHDGYFFVADTGALNGNQLDLYTGSRTLNWRIIGSGRTGRTMTAYIVTDRTIIARLKAEHIAATRSFTVD